MKFKKLPSGNYRCQIMIKGKKYSVTGSTVAECKEKEAQIRANSHKIPSKINFKDAMEELLDAKENVLSANTMKGYKTISKYIESLYDYECGELTSLKLQKFINEFSKTHSPHTCSNVWSFIQTILKSVNEDANYHIKLPQRRKREVTFPNEEEVRMMIDNASDELKKAIMLAAFIPARRGEVSALKYKDIEGNTIHIHATITQDNGYEYKDTPKSSAGDRYVKLPKELIELLGEGKQNDFVVGLTPESIYMRFKRLLKRLNLPMYRFHDLRVFGCSWLHYKGYTNSEIMQRSGHETEACLVSVYRKNLTSDDDVVKDISNFFANSV